MKCANPTCTHKAHQGRKKCFQCLLSKAKYMRYYRERRGMAYIARVVASAVSYITTDAARKLASKVDAEMCDLRFTAEYLETPEGIALDSGICDKLVAQWDKERLAGEPNIVDIPVSAPPAGKSLGVSGSNAAQP